MSVINDLITFKIIKTLTTPWNKQDAFKYGLIDEKGKRTDKKAETREEKNSIDSLHKMVFNLKRLIDKTPFINKQLASYIAATVLLLKEEYNLTEENIKMINEEIVGSGSTGTLASGENMVDNSKILKRIEPDDMFNGYAVFDVDDNVYHKNLGEKPLFKRWKRVLSIDEDEQDFGENERIRDYVYQNPKTGIILRKKGESCMRVVREAK